MHIIEIRKFCCIYQIVKEVDPFQLKNSYNPFKIQDPRIPRRGQELNIQYPYDPVANQEVKNQDPHDPTTKMTIQAL